MCKPQEQGRNAHTHTHVPVPGLRQKPLGPAVKSGRALRFPRAPHTCHLTGKEQPPAPLLRHTALQGRVSTLCCADPRPVKASLPGWRSGLLCSQSGSRLGLHVTRHACSRVSLLVCGAPAHGAGLCCHATGEAQSAQADGSTQAGGAGRRDSDPPPLPQIPLLPPPILY